MANFQLSSTWVRLEQVLPLVNSTAGRDWWPASNSFLTQPFLLLLTIKDCRKAHVIPDLWRPSVTVFELHRLRGARAGAERPSSSVYTPSKGRKIIHTSRRVKHKSHQSGSGFPSRGAPALVGLSAASTSRAAFFYNRLPINRSRLHNPSDSSSPRSSRISWAC